LQWPGGRAWRRSLPRPRSSTGYGRRSPRAASFRPESIIADGSIRRCDAAGKNGKGDAAYLLHLDGIPAGGAASLPGRLDAIALPI